MNPFGIIQAVLALFEGAAQSLSENSEVCRFRQKG
jgi:hypothetical protein